MARKGFAASNKEKIIYDNTVFRGVNATTDPNTEGYFKQLVNFDISDTGQSLQPRKGFINTSLHLKVYNETTGEYEYPYVNLNAESTIYFLDHTTGNYFFIDFSKRSGNSPYIYRVDLNNIDDSKYFIAVPVTTVVEARQIGETTIYLGDYLSKYTGIDVLSIAPVSSHKAEFTKDENFIDRSIIKVKAHDTSNNSYRVFWLGLKYNSNTDAMLFTVVDTENTVSIADRNIASDQSIIPNPMSIVYNDTNAASADGITYNRFDMIYKQKNNHYFINYVDNLNNLVIQPNYYLLPAQSGYKWVYTYDIISTSANTNNVKYESPVFDLLTNENILKSDDPDVNYNIYSNFDVNLNSTLTYGNIPDEAIISGVTPPLWRNDRTSGTAKLEEVRTSTDKFRYGVKEYVWPEKHLDDYTIYIVPKKDTASSTNQQNIERSYLSIFTETITADSTTKYVIDPMALLKALFKRFNIGEPLRIGSDDFITNRLNQIKNIYTIADLINFCSTNKDIFSFYVVQNKEVVNTNINDSTATTYNCYNTALNSPLVIFEYEPIDYDTLYNKYFKDYKETRDAKTFTIRPLYSKYTLPIYNNVQSLLNLWYYQRGLFTTNSNTNYNVNDVIRRIEFFFPKLFDEIKSLETSEQYENLYCYISSYSDIFEGLTNNSIEYKNIRTSGSFIVKKYYVYTSCTSDSLDDYLTYNDSHDLFIFNNLVSTISTGGNILAFSNRVYVDNEDDTKDIKVNTDQFRFKLSDMYMPMHERATQHLGDDYHDSLTENYYRTLTYINPDVSIFTNVNGSLSTTIPNLRENNRDTDIKELYDKLYKQLYFSNGIMLVLYFAQIPTFTTAINMTNIDISYLYFRSYVVASTNLFNSLSVALRVGSESDSTNIIPPVLIDDPERIKAGKDWCIFYSVEGYRLVTWYKNTVYMSEASNYYYFREDNKKSYAENVVTVLPFKDMLLVFTTQNMYSIFPYEVVEQVQDGTDDEGNPKYVQQKTVVYNTLPVLYNLYTDEKYKDVIKVYNGMILFYAADGQLYLITPSTQIDSDTAFAIKFINKSANDILLNYDQYINKRLSLYYNAKDFNPITKDDVKISASVSVSFIKIYYTVPKYTYTYILIYDIINNRYSVYDTASFGSAQSIVQTNMYDLIITHNIREEVSVVIPYTEPNIPDSNCDLTTVDSFIFIKHDILTELDTGILYLNNQWKKRFRSLQTTYKNLDAHNILYNLDVLVDDIYVSSTMGDTLVLKNLNMSEPDELFYITEETENSYNLVKDHIRENYTRFKDQLDNSYNIAKDIPVNKLTPSEFLKNNTKLFDFSSFSSNKIITHNTNIPSVGKYIELCLRFNSKGRYKLQGFTLIYKEHST